VERVLRTPEHFARAIGETVTVKYQADDGPQRVHGRLIAADDTHCTVASDHAREEIAYDRVTQARTVFEWGPQPRPGRPSRGAARDRAKGARAKERS
jgi:ribosome maturation factor RimP